MAEENWLDGVCNYTGPGADLPLGGYTKISGWAPQILVKTWAILDAEADEGFAEKKTSELKATDIIIGCTMNANLLHPPKPWRDPDVRQGLLSNQGC